ncbi:putative T7SS-secreted protein [Kitasatospora acidiphila]|uniref:putative T7SS-secreted protein n=1 Tax=Kitasatospora acidiphila TaxID=2567942 RepID=UPI003C73007D
MGWLDSVGSGLDHLYKDGKKAIGSQVDRNAHAVGDALDFVGLHDAAHTVDNYGDKIADKLGAQVAELQLGQTDDPKQLVHGDAKAIGESVKHLQVFHDAFESTGSGLRAMDSDHWQGQAAEAFRAKFTPHPAQWLAAADACDKAAKALDQFSQTVGWAQGQAKQAIDAYNAAKKAQKQAQDAYNSSVDSYNKALKTYNDAVKSNNPSPGAKPTDPGPFKDPTGDQFTHAQDLLNGARSARDAAAATAAGALKTAMDAAPPEPSMAERLKLDASDLVQGENVARDHFGGGLIKGAAGIGDFIRGMNPMDIYNITHPATYIDHVNQVAAGLIKTSNHPTQLLSSVVGSGWGSDPFEAAGNLTTNLAFGAVTGGGGDVAVAGTDIAGNATRDAAENAGGNAGRDAVKDPNVPGRGKDDRVCDGDPIDMATGHMTLTQTDAHLAGVLPLLFTRTHDSHYRAGRWMGPTWACTLDERLEIDEEGVVLLLGDGIALAYPNPAPDAPTLPSTGARWPLALTTDGQYTVTDPITGRIRTFRRDPANPALAPIDTLTDRAGQCLTFDYDYDGAPTGIRHSAGYHLEVDTTDSRITALRTAGFELVRYGYTDGHLTAVVNSSGLPMRFEYDDLGRMTAWIDRNDSRYDYVYDDYDRCIAQGGSGGHLRWHYDYQPGLTIVTNSLGAVQRYEINELHQVTASTDALGHTTRFVRDRFHRLIEVVDPLGHATRFEYDEFGNVTTVVRPDGVKTSSVYGPLGLAVSVVDPDGSVWHRSYDDQGNCTALIDPTGLVTRFSYDAAGHLTAVTDSLGHRTSIRCDAAGLVVEAGDKLSGVTRFQRDEFGRPVAVSSPLGNTTKLVWSIEGRLISRTAPDGATEEWTYDPEGNVVARRDQLGGVTVMAYTDFDLLASRTTPDGARYAFEYDAELRLVEVTSPLGLKWHYRYDLAGRLTAETDFDGRMQVYSYFADGRIQSRTNAVRETVAYTYDAVGRVASKDVQGVVTSYDYDLMGRLVSAVSPGVELIRDYDRLGRLIAESVNGRTLAIERDQVGRRRARRTPSGVTSNWGFDATGALKTLTTAGWTMKFTRDAAGREICRDLGNDVSLAQSWDSSSRLTGQVLASKSNADANGLSALLQREYSYQADGSLVGITDQSSGILRFILDPIGRVASVRGSTGSEEYAYDGSGNLTATRRVGRIGPGSTLPGEFAYEGTRVRQAGNLHFEYDAQGRVVRRRRKRVSRKSDVWRYTWDAEDRLTSVITPDGQRWRYLYDPFGRRVAKQRTDDKMGVVEWTDFTWDGTSLVEQVANSPALPGPYAMTWEYDGLRPLAQLEMITGESEKEKRQHYFAFVTDIVGTPTHLVDPAASKVWSARTSLWGDTTWPADGATSTPLRFPGQYYDPETQLHYNFHRYYDPATAHYLTNDPLGLRAAPNARAYVHNPTTWADPLGLAPDDCPITPTTNGGSWDPAEAPYLYRGVSYADGTDPISWQRAYENALQGRAEPNGTNMDVQRHVGGNTEDSGYTSWSTDYEDVALDYSREGNGPGVVLRIPNADGAGYFRVPGVNYVEDYASELEVTIGGTVADAEISVNGGPWTRFRQ